MVKTVREASIELGRAKLELELAQAAEACDASKVKALQEEIVEFEKMPLTRLVRAEQDMRISQRELRGAQAVLDGHKSDHLIEDAKLREWSEQNRIGCETEVRLKQELYNQSAERLMFCLGQVQLKGGA